MTDWRNRKTLMLSRNDMIDLLEPEAYVRCVETAFRRHGEGRYFMDPKGHIVLDQYPGEWEIMPSYIEDPEGPPDAAAACKWVSIRFENRAKFDLPTVFSILVYTEPETGFPLAIIDGTHHTLMRTGASGAVSAKWMAREDSKILALVGAGDVCTGTLRTIAALFDWAEVRVWSRTQATLDGFMASEVPRHPGLAITASTNLEDVVPGADVVVTGTTGESSILPNALVEDGMHIAALGGGLAGTQEMDVEILKRARVFADDMRQCITDGEINVPLAKKQMQESDVIGEIGEVITGAKPARQSASDITLFDSTGIALQDSATLPLEYERAIAAGVGVEMKMIST